jgi:hypothetical protein
MPQFDQLTEHVCTAMLTGSAKFGCGGTSKTPTDCDHIVAYDGHELGINKNRFKHVLTTRYCTTWILHPTQICKILQ